MMLELFADERVCRRVFDVHGEAVKFVSDRLVADLLKSRLQVILPLLGIRDVQSAAVDLDAF